MWNSCEIHENFKNSWKSSYLTRINMQNTHAIRSGSVQKVYESGGTKQKERELFSKGFVD